MKTRKYAILLAAVAIVAAMLACNAVSTTPTVSNIRMTTDDSGKTSTSSYAPGAAFYVFADLSGLTKGQVVEAKWYAVSAQGVDPNSEINTSDYTYETGIGFVYFQLTTNDGGDWPTGAYRVELYLDGTKVGEQGFTVQ
jgi:poly(3-hydroxybutyrate) depolymerase